MKKGVKIAIIVGAIFLVIAFVGGYFFINDVVQKAKILEEFEKIEEITNSENFDMESFNNTTSTIVATGKYANVEKAAKKYASDLFNTVFRIKTLMEDEKMTKLLTAENYQNDGPEFVQTKKYLSETKQQLEENRQEMLSYLEETKINSYIEAETTDESSVNMYKEFVTQDIEISDTERKELENAMNKIVKMLEIAEEVIDFLITNNGKWKVQGGQILFNSNNLVVTYNGFLTKLRIL